MARRPSPYSALAFSLVVGLLLSVLPLPPLLQDWRPEWLKLVVIFWVMNAPMVAGIWLAVFSGLLLDVLLAVPLGLNASSLVFIVYVARMTKRWSGVFSIRQTSLLVCLLLLGGRLLNHVELALAGDAPEGLSFYLPALSSALIWPTVMLSLRRWTQR